MDSVVTVNSVYKTYDVDTSPVRALRGATIEIADGEFCAIMGPSGCGKSTLLNVVAGLDQADEGTIIVDGATVTGTPESTAAQIRRHRIGFVFQFFNLLESMTAVENVAMPALLAGAKRSVARRRARDLLGLLGMLDKGNDLPATLSGGERQRLAIARALANEPTILLADEPTGALDSDGAAEILELFCRLHDGGQSILMVTHHHRVAEAADRVVHMLDGRLTDDAVDAR